MGVLIVQVDDEAHQNLVVLHVIDEAAAARVLAQGPAHGVDHAALLELLGGNLPDLLHAQAEFLRVMAVRQVQPRHDVLGQRSAHALGDEDVFAVQLHPRLIAVADAAIGVAAEFARDHALDAITVPDHLAGGHAGEDLDAQLLGLFGHPAADIAHADDVIAVVRHQGRHRPVRDAHLTALAQHEEIVVGHGRVQRRALFLPVGDQPRQARRVQHRARQDMGADLGALLQHHDGDLGVDLLQADRGRKTRGPRANDHDIVFHRFAFDPGLISHPLVPSLAIWHEKD